ncbi:uncharacterized protein Dana_GF17698, isoform D [Drosophila ananassae]|uniref:Uncharacterized protein, isoform D n=1 Tax=Drosophila ananassae TaxID=7217 RepID=A0A0N8P1B0_DROAN|nr:adenylate cyclase, terminal-differentiation specific isoform X1 [Drosophila ananassae]KPU79420.1 uncharacterized protein Dana_GF17698, isoform D [Drosophila ananassae]
MEIPQDLVPLMSCGQCRRRYDIGAGIVPKEMSCKHIICGECVISNQFGATQEIVCLLCGVCTRMPLQGMPEPRHIMFLLREMPALLLGRAIMGFSGGRGDTLVNEMDTPTPQEEGDGGNWLRAIDVENFLATNSENCILHSVPNSIWCHNCNRLLCRACSEGLLHVEHRMTRQLDYNHLLRQLLDIELGKIRNLAVKADEYSVREMTLLRQVCEACYHVQLHVKRGMLEHKPSMIACQMRGWCLRSQRDINRSSGQLSGADMVQLLYKLCEQHQRYKTQLLEVNFQCRMRAAINENGMQVLDFEKLNERLMKLRSFTSPGPIPHNVDPPPALILTNYCVLAYWSELQQNTLPVLCRTPPPVPELLPQSRRAVVPPNFNRQRRDFDVVDHLAYLDMMQDRVLQQHPRYYSRYDDYTPDRSGSVESSGSVPQREPQPQMPAGPAPEPEKEAPEQSQARLDQQFELAMENFSNIHSSQQQHASMNDRLRDLRIQQDPGFRAQVQQQEQLQEAHAHERRQQEEQQQQQQQGQNLGPSAQESSFQEQFMGESHDYQHLPHYQYLSAQSWNPYWAMEVEQQLHQSNGRRSNSNTTTTNTNTNENNNTNNNNNNNNHSPEEQEPEQEPDQEPEEEEDEDTISEPVPLQEDWPEEY